LVLLIDAGGSPLQKLYYVVFVSYLPLTRGGTWEKQAKSLGNF